MLQEAKWFQAVLSAVGAYLETNSTHALLAAARVGVGVAVLPRFVARGHDDLVEVSDAVATHDVWLITHPEFRRDPKVRATADFLRQIVVSRLDGRGELVRHAGDAGCTQRAGVPFELFGKL